MPTKMGYDKPVVCFLFILQVSSPNIPPASGSFISISVWYPKRRSPQDAEGCLFTQITTILHNMEKQPQSTLPYISQAGESQQQSVAQGALVVPSLFLASSQLLQAGSIDQSGIVPTPQKKKMSHRYIF